MDNKRRVADLLPLPNISHYAKLSRAMRPLSGPLFFNNEIYCYPLSKKRCRPPLRSPPARRSEGIVTSSRQQRNEYIVIGIDTKIEVIVASPTTWEAHHSPRAKPEGCGELPRSLVTQQWPKWRYQFLFYHDETKSITNKQKNAR